MGSYILMQNGFDAYNFAGGYRLYGTMYYDEVVSKNAYDCGMEK